MNVNTLCFLALLILSPIKIYGQENRDPIYDPLTNAESDLLLAIQLAQTQNKHIFIQIGGNWCSWCFLFNDFCKKDRELDSLISSGFIPLKINYSRENYNKPTLAKLGYPQRFGFPVFVIVNQEGKVLHIQDSSLLEEDRGYNRKKVFNFFSNWSPDALNPNKY